MKTIQRPIYLNRLIEREKNGLIKVITGLRRVGKSFLLFNLFYHYLLKKGVTPQHIITAALDDEEYLDLHQGKKLLAYIKEKITTQSFYYILLDEIQLCNEFEFVLNALNRLSNVDIYVTGSNSKFLSTDVLTEFRGRGDEVRVYPLSFAEYTSSNQESLDEAWANYVAFGGLPLILSRNSAELKAQYLTQLSQTVYLQDIENRYSLRGDTAISSLLNLLASNIGSLTNPSKLAAAFKNNGLSASEKTLSLYIEYLLDAFLIEKASRYDIKGKKYINSPFKYYFTDVGIRNAQLNFRQQEENHILENIIYNELLVRGFKVDVGVVHSVEKIQNNKTMRKNLEIDFVCNKASERIYIQSALTIATQEKLAQEQRSFEKTRDSFKKIIVTKERTVPWYTEQGILVVDIFDFLLDPHFLS